MRKIGTTGKVIDPRGVQNAAHYNNHPSGVEAIVVCRRLSFNLGNAFKYVFRRKEKSELMVSNAEAELKNLDKALYYLKDEKKHLPTGVPTSMPCIELLKIAEAEPDLMVKGFYLTLEEILVRGVFPQSLQRLIDTVKVLRRKAEEE